jgi:trk system potassium uptake protein TrkA
VIDEDDEVFVIAAAQDMHAVMAEFRPHDKPAKSLFLAGGGNIGKRLALNLEQRCRVKILERNPQRSEALTRDLRHTIVLRGDITDSQALSDEKVEYSDVFCALTNDDEANILSAMLAKDLGARKVMAIINRAAYVSLMHAGLIDIVISPQQTTIGSVLARVRRGDMLVVHSLRRGMAEAIELVAHGNKSSSAVVGRTVEQVSLPRDTTISTIVRGEKVIMAHHNTLIESGDHVILFLANKRQISEIERLFAVSAVLA